MSFTLPHDLHEFAASFVWYECPERYIRNEKEYRDFLVFLLAKAPVPIINHARESFNISDDDFRQALKTAKLGIFIYEESWKKYNEELGIVPCLPFPRKKWSS